MNLIISLAKKYKQNNNFPILINENIKKNLYSKKIDNKLYLMENETSKYNENLFTYYFTPFNIVYFLNMKTNENTKKEYFLLKESILESLKEMKIKYIDKEDETSILFKNKFFPNVETLTSEVNDKLWFFSTLLLKPQKTILKNSINELTKCFNIRGIKKNINLEVISSYMFLARPDKFFPKNKYTSKLFLRYDNILYDEKNVKNIDLYLKNCLDVTNRFNRVLFYEYSIDYKNINENEMNRILYFLNDKNLKINTFKQNNLSLN